MVQVSYPGVYVQEVPSGVRTITGVATSIAAFVGMAKDGPLFTPTTVLGFTDYARIFSNDITQGEMTDQVRQFFLNGGNTQFMIQFQGGLEVQRDLYVTFIPAFGFGSGVTVINLPLGIQYDIPIRSVPNLYVYPRFSMGLGLITGGGTQAAFNIIPEFGIKYVIDGKFNVGFEPFSLPIFVADAPGLPATQYRLTFLGGMNF